MNFNKLVLDLKSHDEDMRIFACMSIVKSDEISFDIAEKLFELLIELTQDKNICVRFYAKKSLNRVKELLTVNARNSFEETESYFVINDLRDTNFIELMKSFEEYVQSQTTDKTTNEIVEMIYKYGKYNQPEITRHLLQILNLNPNNYIKATIIKILGFKNDSDIIISLTPFLNDPDPRVRSNTVEALERIHNPESIRLIVPLLQDTDNRVRATAAKVLSTFGEENVYNHLSEMLNSFELWMRESAVHALSQIKTTQAKYLLLKTLNDNSEGIKIKVIEALQNYPDSDVLKHIEVLTRSKETNICTKAFEVMKQIQLALEKGKMEAEKDKMEKSLPFDFSSPLPIIGEIDTQTVPFKPMERFEIPIIDDVSIEKRLRVDPKILKVYRTLKEEYNQGIIKDSKIHKLMIEIERLNFTIQQREEKLQTNAAGKQSSKLLGWIDDNLIKKSDSAKQKEYLKRTKKKKEELLLQIGEHLFEAYKENRVTYADLGELIIKSVKKYLESI